MDEKLNFGHHITEKIAKANKCIGVLSYRVLLTIYKCFIRPNLHYDDFVYDHPKNDSQAITG